MDDSKFISIVNCDRNSRDLHFSEPATLEALKRCGINSNELNFRPKSSFKKPGADQNVTKLLFEKNEEKRKKLFQQVEDKRTEIVKQEQQSEPVVSRSVANDSEIDEARTEKIHFLKKFLLKQLRDLFFEKFHLNAWEKTNAKMEELHHQKLERDKLLFARRGSAPNLQNPAFLPMLQPPPEEKKREFHSPYSSHIEGLSQRINEQAQKVQQRSKNIFEEKQNKTQKRIDHQNELDLQFTQKKDEQYKQILQRGNQLQEKSLTVQSQKQEREESLRVQRIQKIQKMNEVSRMAQENFQKSIEDDLNKRKALYEDRVSKVNRVHQEEYQRRERTKEKILSKLDESSKRVQQEKNDAMLSKMEESLTLEEKCNEVRRRKAGTEYITQERNSHLLSRDLKSREMKQSLEKEKELQKFELEQKYAKDKEEILAAIRQLKGFDDQKTLNVIQKIIGISKNEMTEIVQTAQDPQPKISKKSVLTRAASTK